MLGMLDVIPRAAAEGGGERVPSGGLERTSPRPVTAAMSPLHVGELPTAGRGQSLHTGAGPVRALTQPELHDMRRLLHRAMDDDRPR